MPLARNQELSSKETTLQPAHQSARAAMRALTAATQGAYGTCMYMAIVCHGAGHITRALTAIPCHQPTTTPRTWPVLALPSRPNTCPVSKHTRQQASAVADVTERRSCRCSQCIVPKHCNASTIVPVHTPHPAEQVRYKLTVLLQQQWRSVCSTRLRRSAVMHILLKLLPQATATGSSSRLRRSAVMRMLPTYRQPYHALNMPGQCRDRAAVPCTSTALLTASRSAPAQQC